MESFKERCISLRRSDHTLIEIVKITGRPKTSVYEHIKNIPLSLTKRKLIKENSASRISALSSARKGKSEREFKRFARWNEGIVSLVAHLVFDGEIKHSGCVYNNRNQSLLYKVESQMKSIYNFEPTRYTNPLTGVNRISYFNVEMSIYFRKKAAELMNTIEKLPIKFKREFLKAFFDDEGCMDFREKRNIRQVRGYQKNVEILLLVHKLLKSFDIASHIHKPNEIVISKKENLKKFQKEINFSPGIYINGNRSNSIWKKSLEKRILLDNAIKSFKL